MFVVDRLVFTRAPRCPTWGDESGNADILGDVEDQITYCCDNVVLR
jgi:hypothetical protein